MEQNVKHWWVNYPWRMIQTNLREIDMEDIVAEDYVRDLKDMGATVVLLNAAGIIASYNTGLEVQPKSRYLHGDDLGKIIDECHKSSIRVIARTDFSKVHYGIYEKHPDWAYRTVKGDIVNYNGDVHTCPNGEYQQEYMMKILQEVLTKYPFDGVFCNMSGFLVVDYSGTYHGPCHCENCQRKFKEQFGDEIPDKDDPRNPVYRKYMAFKNKCTKEHKARIYKTIKDINPEIAINGLDYIRTESNTEIGREQWQYSASSNARKIVGANRLRPADNACVDFMGFRYRNISVSPELMKLRQWQNLANAGSVSLYIMGRLDNHKDISSYEGTKKIFQFHKDHEEMYTHMTSSAKVMLIHKGMLQRNDPEVYGWIRALTESHVPFDEMNLSELKSLEPLKEKRILLLGDTKFLSDKQASLIDGFVAVGKIVIATGDTGLYSPSFEPRKEMALECLGITAIREKKRGLMSSMFEVKEEKRFTRCKKAPFIAPGEELILVDCKPDTQKYMRLIPEHPFGPPERCYYTELTEEPGVLVNSYGKGKAIYIPWMIGGFYFKEGYQNTLNLMQDVLFDLADVKEIAPGLTPMVELSVYKWGDRKILQLINGSGVFANSYFEPLPIRNITLKLENVTKHENIQALNGGKVFAEYEGNELKLTLFELQDYEAIIIS